MVVFWALEKTFGAIERHQSGGKGPCALTHIVLLGRWLGAWCRFLSYCFAVAAAAAAAVAAVAVGLDYGVVAGVVVNGQQSQILGENCDSRYHPGTNGKK
jgi:hypothetical protein